MTDHLISQVTQPPALMKRHNGAIIRGAPQPRRRSSPTDNDQRQLDLYSHQPQISSMKLSKLSLLALSATVVSSRYVEGHEKDQVVLNADVEIEMFLIETAPGNVLWVTEEQKWELRRVGSSGIPCYA
jgi:hypothetical protein